MSHCQWERPTVQTLKLECCDDSNGYSYPMTTLGNHSIKWPLHGQMNPGPTCFPSDGLGSDTSRLLRHHTFLCFCLLAARAVSDTHSYRIVLTSSIRATPRSTGEEPPDIQKINGCPPNLFSVFF